MSTRLSIDIWSDVMCPWCVIGYKQLEKALALLEGEVEAEVRWRPFELNRDMPAEGEDSAEHVARKYGVDPVSASQRRGQMEAIGRRAGYSFAYAGEGDEPPLRIWNTFLAHKLLAHALRAEGPDLQTRLKLALFDAHFQHRRNVSDRTVLLDVAQAVGLDRAAAEAALDDPALAAHVRREEALAFDANITAVPAMVVNGRYLIPGAQDPAFYADALLRVAAREKDSAEGP